MRAQIKNHTAADATVGTLSGHYFNLLEPETSVILIKDIASGLSKCCRYAGQCEGFYSVAQHSVLASYIVAPEHRLAALFHDASEAYTGDITGPLKQLIAPIFKPIEKRIEAAIFARFGIPYPIHACVKEADLILRATEKRDLMIELRDDEWESIRGYQPLAARIFPMEHLAAHGLWMARYRELTSEYEFDLPFAEAC